MGKISVCTPHHATILTWVHAGISTQEMAERLGITLACLQGYLKRRRIFYPPGHRQKAHTAYEQEMAIFLAQGQTHQAIAAQLGVHVSTIQKRATQLGLETARTGPRTGAWSQEWKGGRLVDKHGYIAIHVPLHPHARRPVGRVAEHRLVLEVVLGRYLLAGEVVNHLDNHPRHNWPENLQLYASNADHLRAELTGREKATPRLSIPGAYGSNQKIARCPDESETLAQCSSEIRQKLAWYIESHRPTRAHQTLSKRQLLRQGAWRDPFQEVSMG